MASRRPAPAASQSPGLSLKGRALRLLARREHSRTELERKLQVHAEDPAQLAAVLDLLQAKGFIDESRVAESVLHRRAPRLGTARVIEELRGKGVPAELVRQARNQLAATEGQRALEVWRRRFGEPPADAATRARQMRFLASRGFSAEAVRAVVPATGGQVPEDGAPFGSDTLD